MLSEQQLVEKWRKLEATKRQQVAELINALENSDNDVTKPRSLGEELRQIRAEIVASGVPLLDWEGVEREKAERRGEQQDTIE